MRRERAGRGIAAAAFCVAAFAACPAVRAQPSPPAEAAPAVQPALTVDQLLDKMESVRKDVKTFKAEVLKVRKAEGLDDSFFTGNIQFKTPRFLRLELKNKENGQETISIVGETYGWIYRPQLKQVEIAKLGKMDKAGQSGNPLEYGLARDMHGLREGYTLKILPAEKVGQIEAIPLEMTPVGGTTYARGRLIFWISPKSWLPVQVREYKSNDEVVETHTFSGGVVNARIPDSTFEFKVPKGVQELYHDEPEPSRP